jgi:hypothetical protein
LADKWNAHAAKMQGEFAAKQQAEDAAKALARDTENRAQEVALKTEWGQAHAENMGHVRQAATQFLTPFAKDGNAAGLITAIESEIGFANTLKLLQSIGKGLATGKPHGLGSDPSGAPQRREAVLVYGDQK